MLVDSGSIRSELEGVMDMGWAEGSMLSDLPMMEVGSNLPTSSGPGVQVKGLGSGVHQILQWADDWHEHFSHKSSDSLYVGYHHFMAHYLWATNLDFSH